MNNIKNQYGKEIDLTNLKSKKVIFFYPKANTPGWKTETNEFGEFYNEFKKLGVEVFGASKDEVEKQFKFSEKLNTPFDLLSDVDGVLCEKFGVWKEKKFMGKTKMGIVRSTYFLNEENEIVLSWENIRVKGHVEKVLSEIKEVLN